MAAGRYIVEDQPELVDRLDRFLAGLREHLLRQNFSEQVQALLLAGGYGRGEGGVFREQTGAAPQLYNDLEFYLILTDAGDQGAANKWMEEWSHRGDAELGIEVEFKLLRESPFRNAEPSMFYYDLLAAHHPVHDPADFASSVPKRLLDPAFIPVHEATRLLFNRGSGLFFSFVALEQGDERTRNGFIERNHAKVHLALGDAVLALNMSYHSSCVEREARLGQALARVPPDLETIRAWHKRGVEFKLRPRHLYPDANTLRATQTELTAVWTRTWLWLEQERLAAKFPDAQAYARYSGRLYPQTPIWRAFALHLRDRLRRKSALPGWLEYPRAALQRALVVLLQPQPDLQEAGRKLGCQPTLEEIHVTYERWWRLYN